MAKVKRTKTEQLQEIVNDYIAAGQPWPAGRRQIAAWAIHNRRWKPRPRTAIDLCAKELAEAMRAEMETDPQGRSVRAKHCARIVEKDEEGNFVQQVLWFDRSAKPALMHLGLQQLRRGILLDAWRLKTEQDSYNDNNKYGAHIQLSFNFEDDIEEMGHSPDYRPPDDADDDE